MKKYLAAAGIASVVGVAGLTGASVVNAMTPEPNQNRAGGLVDEIADRFNLNKADVQGVFDEQRATMQAEREAAVAAEIAQLVKDGELTQEQADKINAKRAELQKERDANRAEHMSLTVEERQAERDKHHDELEAWAKENGIDTEYLRYVMGGGRGNGQGGQGNGHGRMGGMMRGYAADTNTSSN